MLAGRFPPTVRKPVGRAALGRARARDSPTPSSSTIRSPGRARTTPARRPPRTSPASAPNPDGPFDRQWMQEHFRSLLGLRPIRDRVDKRAARPTAATRSRSATSPATTTLKSRSVSPTGSTTRLTTSTGSWSPTRRAGTWLRSPRSGARGRDRRCRTVRATARPWPAGEGVRRFPLFQPLRRRNRFWRRPLESVHVRKRPRVGACPWAGLLA